MDRLHQAQVWEKMEEKDDRNNPKPFSFEYAKRDGTLATYRNAVLSSQHYKGKTVNILLQDEQKPKTFRKVCFTRFNEYKLFI